MFPPLEAYELAGYTDAPFLYPPSSVSTWYRVLDRTFDTLKRPLQGVCRLTLIFFAAEDFLTRLSQT